MKGRKIVTVLIIINLILVGIIYSLINKGNVNDKKQIIKEMTETEYEDNIKSLNASHEEYANHIEESKQKIANAITEKGVQTSKDVTLEIMANNIKSISGESVETYIVNSAFRSLGLVIKEDNSLVNSMNNFSGEYFNCVQTSDRGYWTITALKDCTIFYISSQYSSSNYKLMETMNVAEGETISMGCESQAYDGITVIKVLS